MAFLSLLWRLLFVEQWNCNLCCRLSCAQKEQEVVKGAEANRECVVVYRNVAEGRKQLFWFE